MPSFFAVETARAHPHVGGHSTRSKAKPVRLTRLAARIMCATGNFSTRRSPPRTSVAPFLSALIVLLAGATLVITADARHADSPLAAQAAVSEHMFSLGVGDFSPPAAVDVALDAQDRFEIARFYRLTAQTLSPAAGPSAPR